MHCYSAAAAAAAAVGISDITGQLLTGHLRH